MKKVTNITLGGSVFVIDDSAYEKMSTYLSSIENKFSKNDDYKEIIFDIEHAIAEKFTLSGKDEKHAVTLADVEQVILEMGNADAITSEDTGAEAPSHKEQKDGHNTEQAKRFYRDTDDVIIAGVASGIARYFDIDPVIVRLVFVVSLFLNGFGLVAYIILWLIVPRAETTAQKYAMRGERMTITEIREHVKKRINEIDENKICKAKGFWTNLRSFLQNVFTLLGKAVHVLFHALRLVLGFAILVGSALSIAGIVSVLSVLWLGESAWLTPVLQDVVTALLAETSGYVLLIALSITLFIPFLILLTLGASLLAGKNLFSFLKVVTLGVLWITALTVFASLALISQPALQTVLEKNNIQIENIPTHGLMQ